MERNLTISLKVNSEFWKKVQHYCIDKGKSYSEFVEEVLKEKLEKKENGKNNSSSER